MKLKYHCCNCLFDNVIVADHKKRRKKGGNYNALLNFKKFCKKKLQKRSFMFGNPKYDLQLARQTKNQKNLLTGDLF